MHIRSSCLPRPCPDGDTSFEPKPPHHRISTERQAGEPFRRRLRPVRVAVDDLPGCPHIEVFVDEEKSMLIVSLLRSVA
jgi:hypothetical protein